MISLEGKQKTYIKTETISGAQAVLKCLLYEGVDTIFGYPGGAIMPIYDALYHYTKQINHILVCHEQGAAHAAQGYARVSGKVGVCFATSGPGATNLITGIADAQMDSTPIICITGQVVSQLLGSDAFQETNIIGISTPITKWNYQISQAEEIPQTIAKAFYIARSGRPGPVLIDITKNAQFDSFDFSYEKCERIRSYQPYPILNQDKIKEAAKIINGAKKPFLLVGQGVILSEAEDELITFAEKGDIPIASTLMGLSAVPVDHPLYVGYLGMHGNYGPNIKTNECDVLIAVGMRFDDRVTGNLDNYAKQSKIIHIEIDEAEINKNVKTDVSLHADAKVALIQLKEAIKKKDHKKWIEEFYVCDKIEFEKIIDDELNEKKGKIRMAEVIKMLSDKTNGKALIVTDVGQHQMITSRYYDFKGRKQNITSGGLGTMGFALPAAIGSKLADSSKQVIAIIGDGGFQMTIQELGTVFKYSIDIKILILNNSYLGMVRQWQELFFDRRYSFTEMVNPDFQLIAKGYGIKALKLEDRKQMFVTIDQFLMAKEPILLEVIVEREENIFPIIPTGSSVSEIRLS